MGKVVWFGGEEFVIFLFKIIIDDGVMYVEVICSVIVCRLFDIGVSLISCIFFIGVIYWSEGEFIDVVLNWVDKVFYFVKNNGCNWIEVIDFIF